MSDIASRVAKRAQDQGIAEKVAKKVLAKGLPLGKTYQNPKVRIHRYRDQVRVTDLTNAGKRGKKVREMVVLPTYAYSGDDQDWLDQQTHQFLTYARSSDPYQKSKLYIKDLMVDFPDDIKLVETEYRGVDVEPYGELFEFRLPLDNGGKLTIKSSPTDFLVVHTARMKGPRGNEFDHDSRFRPRKKKDAVLFYGWMKDNSSKVKSFKGMTDLFDLWKKLGVNYDY